MNFVIGFLLGLFVANPATWSAILVTVIIGVKILYDYLFKNDPREK